MKQILDYMLNQQARALHRVYGIALMRGNHFYTYGDFWTVLTPESRRALATVKQDIYISSGNWRGHHEEEECLLRICGWIYRNSLHDDRVHVYLRQTPDTDIEYCVSDVYTDLSDAVYIVNRDANGNFCLILDEGPDLLCCHPPSPPSLATHDD